MKDADKVGLKLLGTHQRRADVHSKEPKSAQNVSSSCSKSSTHGSVDFRRPSSKSSTHGSEQCRSEDSGDHHTGNLGSNRKIRFKRATSLSEHRVEPRSQNRVRSTSGQGELHVSKALPLPVGFVTPRKSSNPDDYFAMAKFNESPEPSAVPAPPLHWRMSPCKAELEMNQISCDGIDLTAHLKMLLRVEM